MTILCKLRQTAEYREEDVIQGAITEIDFGR